MPTISYRVGMTMHLGNPNNNEYVKKDLEVKEFEIIPGESKEDFVKRVQDVHATFHNLSEWADEQLGNMMLEALNKESV